jgi:hypothetical protein
MKRYPSLLLLVVVAVLAAGCGSSGGGGGGQASGTTGGGSGTDTNGIPNGGGGVNGISVGNCLNNQDYLVQPSQNAIDGQSPGGVNFSLIFFKTSAAAKAAAAKKNPKTTSLVENAVIDFKGNFSAYTGAPPAKISQKDITAIKSCIDQSRK